MGRDNSRNGKGSSSHPPSISGLHHIGLINLGNSCFYNAVLQCLSVSAALEDAIQNPPLSSCSLTALSPPPSATADSKPSLTNTNDSPESLPSPVSPLPLTTAFVALLATLNSNKTRVGASAFNPKSLLRELSKKNHEQYQDASQQDSHELLMHLLEAALMEEVDLIKKMTPTITIPALRERRGTYRAQTGRTLGVVSSDDNVAAEGEEANETESETESGSDGSDESTDSEAEVKVEKKVFRPFVETIFGGKLASYIVCDTCKHVSVTKEDFLDLSLSLKNEERIRRRDKLRKALQAGFFAKKSTTSSLSEAESTSAASASEADTDGATDSERSGFGRRKSLTNGSKKSKSFWSIAGSSRNPSPSRKERLTGNASSRSKGTVPQASSEQMAYIQSILSEITVTPNNLPLQLRWATPGKPSPKIELSQPPSPVLGQVDQCGTDLFQSLREFMTVESLEGENALKCRNCWKLLNPYLVKARIQKRSKRSATLALPNLSTLPLAPLVQVDSLNTISPPPSFELLSAVISSSQISSLASANTTSGNISDDEREGEGDADVSENSENGDLLDDNNLTDSVETRRTIAINQNGNNLPLTIENVAALDSPVKKTFGESITSNPGKGVSCSNLPPKASRYILRTASKRYLLSRFDLPPVLVLHLKRFQQTSNSSLFGGSFHDLKKKDDDFSFPEELDLNPFLSPLTSPSDTGISASARYRLYAAVVHTGSLSTGHYISYFLSDRYGSKEVKSERRWLMASDEDVRAASIDEIKKPYMLFYERIES